MDGNDEEVLSANVLDLKVKAGKLPPKTDCKLSIGHIFYLLLINIPVISQVYLRPRKSSTSNGISPGLRHLFLMVKAAFTNRVFPQEWNHNAVAEALAQQTPSSFTASSISDATTDYGSLWRTRICSPIDSRTQTLHRQRW